MTEQERYNNFYQKIVVEDKVIYSGQILARAAHKWPDRTAYICDDDSITYHQLFISAQHIAQQLKKNGIKSHDRVILLYENSIDFFIAYFGIWLAGAVVAPLNVFLQNFEVENIITNAQPQALIVSKHLESKLGSYLDSNIVIRFNNDDINKARDHKNAPQDFKATLLDAQDMTALLYTSGTTGFPKGVMLSSRNIIVNALQGMARLSIEVKEGDKLYCALPMFHSLPQNMCVWASTLSGSTAIIVPNITRKSLLKGLEYNPKMIVAVPSLYGLFCLIKTARFDSVKYFICGGDALPDKIRTYFGLLYNRKLCNGYGLTETSPFVSADLEDYNKPTSCVGAPLVGIECKITDEAYNKLKQGSPGILWLKGENIMLGYYNNKKATEAVLKDGWFYTGDLAYIDENNNIVIVGRHKDLIINKGINIYPQEIENILLTHPQVYQVGVVGITEDDEEIPVAFIATKSNDYEKLIEELKELARQKLASYKTPRKFFVRSELPLTATGKVNKKHLKEELKKN